MGEHVACIANQGKAIGDNPPDNLHDKNTACYGARQDESFSFMRPVLMFMAMLIFDVIIVYAMDVFDGFSPCPKMKLLSNWVDCLRQIHTITNNPSFDERGLGRVLEPFPSPPPNLPLDGGGTNCLKFLENRL